MKRAVCICLFLLALVSGNAFAFNWESFTPPPKTIPFIENGVVYNAFVQTRHPWYAQNYIVYYPEGIDSDLKPVGTDYNQGAPYQHLWILLNPASYNQAYDSSAYNPNVIVYMCTGNYACQNNTWGNSVSSGQIRYRQYTWFDWNYAGPTGYDLRSDLVRAVGIDIKVNFSYNWDGQFGLPNLSTGDVLVEGGAPPSYLAFPIDGDTAYTAPVSSVMDHSMPGGPYSENNTVLAFNGELGNMAHYLGCYANSDSTAFDMGINYVGTSGTGGAYYLCYDGHPGYDYAFPENTHIHAPANGTLCVATTYTSARTPANVWRNTTECPLPSVVTERWQDSGGFNAFYIFHTEYINGSTSDYLTVFLHSANLESSVRTAVESNGYTTVTKNQHIANVGDVGSSGAYHMHFEVYKWNGTSWIRVDPYGDGTNNVLWVR